MLGLGEGGVEWCLFFFLKGVGVDLELVPLSLVSMYRRKK